MRMRTALVCVTAGLAVISCTTTARVEAHPAATNACSSAVSISGFSDALDKTTFEDTYVGNLSALAVDTDGTTAALSDRSSLFGLDARTHRPVRVVQLADETGTALDSEALVVDQDGTRLVTDETAPAVRRYDRSGTLVGRLPVPAALLVAPAGRATKNLTFEGLALQPGGRTLIASMEGALSGDSSDIVRLQTWRRHSSKSAFRPAEQYGYRVGTGLGISEIAAAGDGRLLVLERGYTSGVGNTVRLYLADPRHATDTGGTEDLTGQDDVRLVRKTLLADIADCPSLGATAQQPQPNPLLDNIEGLAVTGRSSGGALRLLLVSDDNQSTAQTTRLYSLTVRLPRRLP